MRAFTLLVLVALAAIALFMRSRPPVSADDGARPALAYAATAHQLGVVGYRDPVGVLSADGRFVAYSEGRHVRVVPVGGGASPLLPPGDGQVRWLEWLGKGRLLVEATGAAARWWVYDTERGTREPLWGVAGASATQPASAQARPATNLLRQPVASPDGAWIAAVVAGTDGPELWRLSLDGARAERAPQGARPSWPAWMPSGEIECIVTASARTRIAAPCGAEPLTPVPDIDAAGPIAVSPDGARVYFASPNEQGMVDLWQMDFASRRASKLTAFSRDSYGPSVATDGTVLFRTQSYRTFIAELRDGQTRQLTSFQAETPWWHPREPLLSITYGTWRRVIDDAKYPDIAQEIGVIDANRGLSDRPLQVIADSDSEDQAMAWSPNGRWIALHSHREQSDDVWLRPTDGSAPDRRITMLGRGSEVGWPRWSPDGRSVLLDGANANGKSVAYTIGVDQETGTVTSPLREVATPGFDGDMMHAEWMPDGVRLAAVAREEPGRHALLVVAAAGGTPRVVHRVASEHDFPGMTVSPDGAWLGFVAPASDGYYQVFRVPVAGGTPEQLTFDPSHKTQPAWSPEGRLAFTVWSYTSTFWTFRR
jgi:Tol biopolymer transport system component